MQRKLMQSTVAFVLLIGASGLCGNAQEAAGKQVEDAAQQAGKVIKKDAKAVAHAGSTAERKATAAVGRAARVTTATARKMFATPAWNSLSSAYDYDAAAPDVKEEPVANDKAMIIKLAFTGPGGKPVAGVFVRPKADGKYPCALVAHGLTQNKEAAISMFGDALVAKGIAVLALDAPGHGQGEPPNKKYWTKNVITIAVHEGDRNYRRALDYLATRPDVDMEHVGLLGYSMGSIMGSILGAVDDRVTAFALVVGGDPFLPIAKATTDDQTRNAILHVCPSLYIGHIKSHPIIMFNGLADVVVVAPAAKLLQAAAPQPKQVVWYEGGHDTPQPIRTRAVEWLAQKLTAKREPAGQPANQDSNSGAKPPQK